MSTKKMSDVMTNEIGRMFQIKQETALAVEAAASITPQTERERVMYNTIQHLSRVLGMVNDSRIVDAYILRGFIEASEQSMGKTSYGTDLVVALYEVLHTNGEIVLKEGGLRDAVPPTDQST